MTRRLHFNLDALADLDDIAQHTALESGSLDIANGFLDKLITSCEKLAELPGIFGTGRPELLPGMRSTPCQTYLIFFRYQDDTVEIINILAGNRDLASHFDA